LALAALLGGCSYRWSPAAVRGPVIDHGSRARREVALTFDADMTWAMRATGRAWVDRALFAELRRDRAPATIFLTGLWSLRNAALVRRLARDPRIELESHSLDHGAWEAPCYGLPPAGDRRVEVVAAQRIISALTGRGPRYFRFPGGCADAADVRLVERHGERPVAWDVVSGDAYLRDPQAVVRQVLAQVRPGSIVVAHCIGAPNTPATAAAFRVLIPALRARGYRLVTLSRLLR
jgi:peptidoglycan/xylan/chitin deacetylase (PgdA/CDA1 family)